MPLKTIHWDGCALLCDAPDGCALLCDAPDQLLLSPVSRQKLYVRQKLKTRPAKRTVEGQYGTVSLRELQSSSDNKHFALLCRCALLCDAPDQLLLSPVSRQKLYVRQKLKTRPAKRTVKGQYGTVSLRELQSSSDNKHFAYFISLKARC